MKKTETYLLRYSKESVKSHDYRIFPSQTTDLNRGTIVTLLRDKKIVDRSPNQLTGEMAMNIPLSNMVTIKDAKGVDKKYASVTLDLPKREYDKKDFTEPEWQKMQKDTAIVELSKRHLQCSVPNIKGEETNINFHVVNQPHYILVNLDAMESEKAEHDSNAKELGYELSLLNKMEDKTEFLHVCYLFGVNPTGIDYGALYNLLNIKIEKDPIKYRQMLKDPERWNKIVLNKALRTARPNTDPVEMYIIEKEAGQYNNYYFENNHIATGYDALLGYFKDNPSLFEFLENELGMKKKELEGESLKPNSEQKRTIGRPKSVQEK